VTSYGAPNLDLPCDRCGKTLRQRLEEVLPAARGRYEADLLQELRGEDIEGCCYQHHHPFSPCTLCGESAGSWDGETAVCDDCRAAAEQVRRQSRRPWVRLLRWLLN